MSDNFIVHDVNVANLATAGSIAGSDFLLANIGGVHKKVTVASVASGESAVTSVTASAPIASSGGATPNISLTGTVAATLGGTGHAVYAVGDLLYASTTTALSRLADVAVGEVLASGGVGVAPAFTSAPAVSGANLTASTIPLASLASVVPPVYVAAGTAAASTAHIVSDVVTASDVTVTVTLAGSAAFASANYILLIQDEASLGTLIVPSAQAAGSFTFTSTNTHVYQFTAIGV